MAPRHHHPSDSLTDSRTNSLTDSRTHPSRSHPSRSMRNSLLAVAVSVGLAIVSTTSSSPVGAVGPTLPPKKPGAAPATQPRKIGPPAPAPKAAAKPKAAKKSSPKRAAAKPKTAKAASGIGQGAKGAQVTAIQTKLQELKYDIPEVTGTFGDLTYHAVMAFQKLNGLDRTGRVGPQTLAAIESATAPEPMLADGGPDRVEVDIKRQVLLVWKGGEIAHILSVSTGNNKDFCVLDPETNKTECDKAVTPGGSFRVTRRWIGWRESRLGEMYNPLYFNGGIAIHGSPSVPAYPASHGCVRIPMPSAEWFHTVIPDGTPIYVFGPDKTPTPIKSKAPATPPATTPDGSTIPKPSTVPGATTPGATAPAPATTGSTTTTLVRLLTPGATAPATVPPPTATPTAPTSTTPVATTPAPTVATTTVPTTLPPAVAVATTSSTTTTAAPAAVR